MASLAFQFPLLHLAPTVAPPGDYKLPAEYHSVCPPRRSEKNHFTEKDGHQWCCVLLCILHRVEWAKRQTVFKARNSCHNDDGKAFHNSIIKRSVL